jgi:vacuolar protein-sorting-associated protein 4
MTWENVPANKLKEPEVTTEDLLTIMKTVKSSVTEQEIEKYREWTEQFGLEGA